MRRSTRSRNKRAKEQKEEQDARQVAKTKTNRARAQQEEKHDSDEEGDSEEEEKVEEAVLADDFATIERDVYVENMEDEYKIPETWSNRNGLVQREEWGYHTVWTTYISVAKGEFKDVGWGSKKATAARLPPVTAMVVSSEETPLRWLMEMVLNNKAVMMGEFVDGLDRRDLLKRGVKPPEGGVDSLCYRTPMRWMSQSLWAHLEMFLVDHPQYVPDRPPRKDKEKNEYAVTWWQDQGKLKLTGFIKGVLSKEIDSMDWTFESLFLYIKNVYRLAQVLWVVFTSPPAVTATRVGEEFLASFYNAFENLRQKKVKPALQVLLKKEIAEKKDPRLYKTTGDFETAWHRMTQNTSDNRELGWYMNLPYTQLKKAEKKKKEVRKQEAVQRPTKMKEVDVWRVAEGFARVAFAGTKKWDKFTFQFEGKGRARECDTTKIAAAVSLLQLCIGSRSLGIHAVNRIDVVEHVVVADATRVGGEEGPDYSASVQQLLVVSQLTKEKGLAKQALDASKEEDITFEEAEMIVADNIDRKAVTKPFQFYLLDPLNYEFCGGKREDRLEKWSDETNMDCRLVFFSLLQAVRKCIKEGAHAISGGKMWWKPHSVTVGDRKFKYWAVDMQATREGAGGEDLTSVTQFYYRHQNKLVADVFEKVMGLKESTHQLRRLYVCYSYQWFAADRMKEIAYARAVLMHSSFDTAMFYMRVQIQLAVGGGIPPTKLESIKFATKMKEMVDEERKSLKRKFEEMTADLVSTLNEKLGEIEDGVAPPMLSVDESGLLLAVGTNMVTFHKADGSDTVDIRKLVSLRGMNTPRAELVKRAKEKIDELVAHDLVVSKRKLCELRINTNLLNDKSGDNLWTYYLEESA